MTLDTEKGRLDAYAKKHGYLGLYDYLYDWPKDELVEAIFELLGYWDEDGPIE